MVRFRSPAPYGEVPEWPKGADCKSVVSDFGGSNPPLSTTKIRAILHGFSFFEKPLPFSRIFVVLPRNRYSLSKQARIKHKATISLYRLLGVDFFVRFFFVERGGLGCFQTATRFACRTTFRCAHFALASKLARSLLSESTHRSIQSIFHNLLNLPC